MTQLAKLIDALNGTFGRHKGFRASHAKGLAVTGRFIPTVNAPSVDIPLLRSEQPISARFSVGGGKPNMSDKSPSVRGIGIAIGDKSDGWTMALISAPVFFANSAEQFVDFLAARKPDPEIGGPNPEKVKAFNAANPNTVPHQEYLKATAPCRCYSNENYHSGHAYGFAGPDGPLSARIFLEPEAGRIGLTEDEKSTYSDDFLFDTLLDKLDGGPARWTMKLVLANSGDVLDDPTTPWDGEHQEVTLGTIEITQIDENEAGQKRVYDPARMPAEVTAPQDNVFGLRSPAYAVSVARRNE
ncbi:catalase [uncultured Roseobacter sp.]|uniref:catalase n=1 Tax=uncultured Roseobacter sp. TaxID=114847 RepID=UPI0026376076|nr:catalase [uncultured Roseobacter sp.]